MDTAPWSQTIAKKAIDRHSCYQHPAELAAVLQILADDIKPVTVLEIGGGLGGSAWAWGQLPTVKEVITITLPQADRRWLCCPMPAKHWTYLGDSTRHDTVHALAYHLDGRRPDFLWIDGDHTYKTASRDWDLYSPLVPTDGLIGLHDILPEVRWPGFEVDRLWAELKLGHHTREFAGDPANGMGTGLIFREWPA